MTRTTVTIDDKKLDELRSLAAERGVSVSRLVREAIDEKLSKRPPGRQQPKPLALGMGRSKDAIPARDLTDADLEYPPWR